MTVYFNRSIESLIHQPLHRGKSIILLGPRQTGKTTLLKNCLKFDFDINPIVPGQRLKFEKRSDDLIDMIEGFLLINHSKRLPLFMIDEIQRVPALMDVIQYLIDNQKAQFVLTGSSARKLKHGQEQALNLLPGRLVYLTLDALSLEELPLPIKPLEILMQDGLLPGIYLEELSQSIDIDLQSYVEVYLEEEIRQEGIVRNLQAFSRFFRISSFNDWRAYQFYSNFSKNGCEYKSNY